MTNIKKYCLLENGWIEPCYYDKARNEMRMIYKERRFWYLDHDKYSGMCMIRFHHRILAFAETKKELKEIWRTKNSR